MIDNPDALDEKLRPIVRDELARRNVAPVVQQAETVNIAALGNVPHARFIQGVTVGILLGFVAISLLVLLNAYDGLSKGSIIQTWTNMAFGAFTFWLGSSSAGKAQAKP